MTSIDRENELGCSASPQEGVPKRLSFTNGHLTQKEPPNLCNTWIAVKSKISTCTSIGHEVFFIYRLHACQKHCST
jgi:hypothetical protein